MDENQYLRADPSGKAATWSTAAVKGLTALQNREGQWSRADLEVSAHLKIKQHLFLKYLSFPGEEQWGILIQDLIQLLGRDLGSEAEATWLQSRVNGDL